MKNKAHSLRVSSHNYMKPLTLLFSGLITATSINAQIDYYQTAGTLTQSTVEALPSATWPQYVVNRVPVHTDSGKVISPQNRGTLIRCEGNELLIDFGRYGIIRISPEKTDFYDTLGKLVNGSLSKTYPNLTQQIGNKLIRFDLKKGGQQIPMDLVKNTEVYVLVYLAEITQERVQPLLDLGEAYKDLSAKYPQLTMVLATQNKKAYDFAYTVDYSIPMIIPHMAASYIQCMGHKPSSQTMIVLADPNGHILYKKEITPQNEKELSSQVVESLNQIGILWRYELASRNSPYRPSPRK